MKQIKIMKYILIAVISFFSNCKNGDILKDDELSIKKANYSGNQLRIDGYFYQKIDGAYFSVYCFYNNGVILSAGGLFYNQNEISNYIQTEFINRDSYNTRKYNWGAFNVEGNRIKFECWYPSEAPYKAYVRAGVILNDTTFIINESYRMQGGKKTNIETENETYYFKQFSPKPDSTNTFVQ